MGDIGRSDGNSNSQQYNRGDPFTFHLISAKPKKKNNHDKLYKEKKRKENGEKIIKDSE